MEIVFLGLAAAMGGAAGAVAAWRLTRAQCRAKLARNDAEHAAQHAVANERLAARNEQIEAAAKQTAQLRADLDELRLQHTQAHTRVGELTATLHEQRRAVEERERLWRQAQQELGERFKSLSSDALNANSHTFLRLAQERLSGLQQAAASDLDKRQAAIDATLKPLRDSLTRFDSTVQGMEQKRNEAYGSLSRHLGALGEVQELLRKQTTQLVEALRTPAARGHWGEVQLRRVVEMAGMLEHCDFEPQVSVAAGDGRLRPDLLVRLPGDKIVVVDAKTPLKAYLEALEANDDDSRQSKLAEHAMQVRRHVQQLSEKRYWAQFETSPEFVVLFLPGEPLFSAALEKQPDLISMGAEQKVILATPTTLIALLRAVSYGWGQQQVASNARQIQELGKALYERVSTMARHLASIGNHLDKAVGAYNGCVGSMETRVLVTARKLKELGACPGPDVEPIPVVERTCRELREAPVVETTEERSAASAAM